MAHYHFINKLIIYSTISSKEVLTRTYATLPRFRLVRLLCMFIMQRRSMTTPKTQRTLHSLRTVSAPVGCDPSCCVPRTDFNPLLKYSILIFVVCCTTRHISGGHAGVKQSTASTRNMGQPWTPTVTNKIWQTLMELSLHYIVKKHHKKIMIEDEVVQTYSKHLLVI